MIALPIQMVYIPNCPGYFYNNVDKKVYSIKSGTLTPLIKEKGYRHSKLGLIPPRYRISVNGVRKTLTDGYLKKLPNLTIMLTFKV